MIKFNDPTSIPESESHSIHLAPGGNLENACAELVEASQNGVATLFYPGADGRSFRLGQTRPLDDDGKAKLADLIAECRLTMQERDRVHNPEHVLHGPASSHGTVQLDDEATKRLRNLVNEVNALFDEIRSYEIGAGGN